MLLANWTKEELFLLFDNRETEKAHSRLTTRHNFRKIQIHIVCCSAGGTGARHVELTTLEGSRCLIPLGSGISDW
jgi:hypothetical protein